MGKEWVGFILQKFVNFYTCTMYIHFSAVLTVSESVTQVLGICKNNVHLI